MTSISLSAQKPLREHLAKLLKSSDAHASFDTAISRLPVERQGARPQGVPHSPWELLEHLRLAQSDILEFTRDPKHVSPPFPAGYWPKTPYPPNEKSWGESADAFRADLAAFVRLVQDETVDLLATLPHGTGQTVMREALVLADHNAYHIGQLVIVRRLLESWP